jgi:hypothetical protein
MRPRRLVRRHPFTPPRDPHRRHIRPHRLHILLQRPHLRHISIEQSKDLPWT